jgi:O-antigen/teichoic acid export membrane protein
VPSLRRLGGALGSSAPLVAGLVVQAGSAYLTLIIAGRLLGAARFGAISALYVLVASVATGLFLPVEQEIARRRGVERSTGRRDHGLTRRALGLAVGGALVVDAVALAGYPFMLQLLDDHVSLLAALCVALPGYACCFVSRGEFAGTRELTRYGVQLGVDGVFRLLGLLALVAADVVSVAWVGWLFGLAPWVALGVSLLGRRHGGVTPTGPADEHPAPLLAALGLLLVSSLASQLLINAGPVVVQLLARPDERAAAGAFLAALVVVRVPVFLFTAVQPSFLPAMAAHAAADRRQDFLRLTARVLTVCAVLTVLSTAVLAAVGPWLLRVLFDFRDGLRSTTFLAMGLSVGLFLAAAILAQALLGRGWHAATTVGWLVGLVGLGLGTAVPGGAVGRATSGFLLGAVGAAAAFTALFAMAMRRWSGLGDRLGAPAGGPLDQPARRRRSR